MSSSWRPSGESCGAGRTGQRVPGVPAAGRVARTGRSRERRSFAGDDYWGRPVPGFGDPDAAILIVGLAPAAHGGQPNRPDVHRRPQR